MAPTYKHKTKIRDYVIYEWRKLDGSPACTILHGGQVFSFTSRVEAFKKLQEFGMTQDQLENTEFGKAAMFEQMRGEWLDECSKPTSADDGTTGSEKCQCDRWIEVRYIWRTDIGDYVVMKCEKANGVRFWEVRQDLTVISAHDTSESAADYLRTLGVSEEDLEKAKAIEVADRLMGRRLFETRYE